MVPLVAPERYTLANDDRVARFVAASPDRSRHDVDVVGIVADGEVVCAIPANWSHALFSNGSERVLRRGVAALFATLAANPRDVSITQRALGSHGRHDSRLAVLDRLFTQQAPPGAVQARFARVLDLQEAGPDVVVPGAQGDLDVDIDGPIAFVRADVTDRAALSQVIAVCKRAGVRWLELGASRTYEAFGGELVRLPNFTLAARPPVKSYSWLQRFTAR